MSPARATAPARTHSHTPAGGEVLAAGAGELADGCADGAELAGVAALEVGGADVAAADVAAADVAGADVGGADVGVAAAEDGEAESAAAVCAGEAAPWAPAAGDRVADPAPV